MANPINKDTVACRLHEWMTNADTTAQNRKMYKLLSLEKKICR